ncbi:MAG: hypothetical protein JW881_09890 [Spirochaetales bacterium]|nr:hypothetical protein [Spirochaetales bacterium]
METMIFGKQIRKTWLFHVLGKLTLFLVLFSLLLLFLYIVGNFQEFLDATQIFLLKTLEITLLASAIIATYYIVFLFLIAFLEKKIYLLRLVLAIIAIIICLFLFIALKFLTSWLVF